MHMHTCFFFFLQASVYVVAFVCRSRCVVDCHNATKELVVKTYQYGEVAVKHVWLGWVYCVWIIFFDRPWEWWTATCRQECRLCPACRLHSNRCIPCTSRRRRVPARLIRRKGSSSSSNWSCCSTHTSASGESSRTVKSTRASFPTVAPWRTSWLTWHTARQAGTVQVGEKHFTEFCVWMFFLFFLLLSSFCSFFPVQSMFICKILIYAVISVCSAVLLKTDLHWLESKTVSFEIENSRGAVQV